MPAKKEDVTCATISVPKAAEILGFSADYLRWLMREKKLDVGIVIPPKKKGGIYRYKVSVAKLDRLIGTLDENCGT